jgi:rhodanese-related sulfurtransferase
MRGASVFGLASAACCTSCACTLLSAVNVTLDMLVRRRCGLGSWTPTTRACSNPHTPPPDCCCVPSGVTIPSAVNIPLDMLSDAVRAGQLDPYHASTIAVVCASGQRSAQATVRLSKVFGFKNVSNVSGGMAAWQSMKAELSATASGGCGCGNGGSGGCSK